MKLADWIAAVLLFALGCVHNFVAAPMSYDSLSTTALWFVTGGMALWYASFVNFLWLRGRGDRVTRIIAFLTNAILLSFVVTFIAVRRSWTDPQNALLFAPAAWLTLRTAFSRGN